ncbi:hypothetical protein RhiirA4_458053 [Rhizophagus irregularis]|uniref:Uncharacterized protein n=1 Tax=Rhizophagus irregularis TaxID=588596 RepID=A0A2I1GBH1_9GLOM|nr:hypothetical protein RhiirA4_458053 [Rhizophagus irregularis]
MFKTSCRPDGMKSEIIVKDYLRILLIFLSLHFRELDLTAKEHESGRKRVNSGIYENKKSRKRKYKNRKEQLSSDVKNDQSMFYDKVIAKISIAQENNIACQMMYVSTSSFVFLNPSLTCNYRPLCWGIIDLRVENVSPYPKHPRAKELLSQAKV